MKYSSTNHAAGRPPVKRLKLLAYLRGLILSGKLPPGAKLPSHEELERRFHATSATVQESLNTLHRAGFVEMQHRRGTFVTAYPPHRCHYALAFPRKLEEVGTQFYTALRKEGLRLQGAKCRISVFHEIEEHVDVEDYQRLLGFVEAHALAGLIFATNPYYLRLEGSPLVTEPDLPRVAIQKTDAGITYPTVYPDGHAFLPKALDYLAARGHRRVALLGGINNVDDAFCQGAAARGLIARPYWIQSIPVEKPDCARHVMHLLMHAGKDERPDALIISDDNLVESATAGLVDAGVRVPQDLEVIAHTNFPWPTPSAVSVKRLGYDVRQLISLCLERLAQQRRGEIPPMHTAVPPIFEEEFQQSLSVSVTEKECVV